MVGTRWSGLYRLKLCDLKVLPAGRKSSPSYILSSSSIHSKDLINGEPTSCGGILIVFEQHGNISFVSATSLLMWRLNQLLKARCKPSCVYLDTKPGRLHLTGVCFPPVCTLPDLQAGIVCVGSPDAIVTILRRTQGKRQISVTLPT